MPSVEETTIRIQTFLEGEGPFQFDGEEFSIELKSTTCRFRVRRWNQGTTIVHIVAPILVQVPISNALYAFVAQNSTRRYFGSLGLREEEDGFATLQVDHTLLGDTLDKSELLWAIAAIAETADRLDDELQPRFGGSRLSDVSG